MSVLEKYFDVSLTINPVPIVKFVPKKSMVKSSLPTRMGSQGKKIPYTPSTDVYYVIFGDIPRDELYQLISERKSMFSKHNSLKWYIDSHKDSVSDGTIDIIEQYLIDLECRTKDGVIRNYKSDSGIETRKKLSSHMKSHSITLKEINSKNWNDPNWRKSEMERRHSSGFYSNMSDKMRLKYSDPIFKKSFVDRVNSLDRIKKISQHTKECWKDPEYAKKVLGKTARKNKIVSGIRMNSIEAKVAECLNSLGIGWRYENPLRVGENVYHPDFLIENNTVLEIYGDYWHANPMIYTQSDLIFGKMSAKDVWDKDAIREYNIKNAGFIFHKLWQSDVNNDNLEKILCDILKKN
jgi:hypothetical protein